MASDVKKLPIQFARERVVAFCRERGIVRLSVLGSVLRDEFDPTVRREAVTIYEDS